MSEKQRNKQYDLLRFIGISCIILAHVEPSDAIFQLRNFDVPLMVFLSGIAFSEYSSNHYNSYPDYLLSRFFRLILPTWFFLIFYGAVNYIASGDRLAAVDIIKQAIFFGGVDIGIWIIRIFVSIALIAPFIYKIDSKLIGNKKYYIFTAFCYITYELLHFLSEVVISNRIMYYLNIIFFITVPYVFIFMYGLRVKKFTKNDLQKHIIFLGSVLLLNLIIGYLVCEKIVPTQHFKYPPKMYYISFAMVLSITLYYTTAYYDLRIQNIRLIQFVGKSTLWIYLWHWFFIKSYNCINVPGNYIVKYISVYGCTILIVYLQIRLVKKLLNLIPDNFVNRRLILKSFVG